MFQKYPQDNVNEPLDLYEGGFRVHRGDQIAEATGSAALRWLPAPSIEIDIEITEPHSTIDFDSTVELPGFRTEGSLVHSISTGTNCRIGACVSLLESADNCDLVSVGFRVDAGEPTRRAPCSPEAPFTVESARRAGGHSAAVREPGGVRQTERQGGLLRSLGEVPERVRPPQREAQEHRA